MIQNVQNGFQDVWSGLEPYVIPATVATGVALIINQFWGTLAAVCFAGACAGFTVCFPYVVKEIATDNPLASLARLSLIVALPLFGPAGMVASVGISVVSSLAKDFRMYGIRSSVSEIDSKLTEFNRKANNRAALREEKIQEFEAQRVKNTSLLASLQANETIATKTQERLAELQNTRQNLQRLLQNHDARAEERQKTTEEIKADLARLTNSVEELQKGYQELNKQASAIIARTETALDQVQTWGVTYGHN